MIGVSLSPGRDAPIELTMLSLSIAMSGGSIRATVSDDQEKEDRGLVVTAGGKVTHIESRSASFIIRSDGQETEYPWFLPLNPPRNHIMRSGRLRIAIAGGTDLRRLKMTWRTISELRRRRAPVTTIVVGECTLSPSADEHPDELHHELAPAEYLALLDRVDVVLECTDSFGTESFLAVAARDRGVPVVAHADRTDLAAADFLAAVWSADGFVDALLEANHDPPRPADSAGLLDAMLKLIESR